MCVYRHKYTPAVMAFDYDNVDLGPKLHVYM
jgi:hypothetical protein